MSITKFKFIERLLRIKVFSVRSFEFENWYRELWLEVKPFKNGAFYLHCLRRGRIIYSLDEPRVWRYISI